MKQFILQTFIYTLFCFYVNAQERFAITHGPYLQAVGETEATIVWTTNRVANGWVELAPGDSSSFYSRKQPETYETKHGIKKISTLHRVKLTGLKPGTTYRYRILSQEVISSEQYQVNYGAVAAIDVYNKVAPSFTTLDQQKQQVSFSVINDIHGRNDLMKNLLSHVDFNKTDMVFFNGDMANDLPSEKALFGDFMNTAVQLFASQVPMYYVRGNHETRGTFAGSFGDYFPTSSGSLYYLLRQGPVCFVILDSGEDKADTDFSYYGRVAFKTYREEQAAWLKDALTHPVFADAPYKIAICHIPPFGTDWYGERDVRDKFIPLLNAAGVQVMLSGHLHAHYHRKADHSTHHFPILVNDNEGLIKAEAGPKELHISVYDQTGKTVDSIRILPHKKP